MLCAMLRWRGWAIVFGMTLLGFINVPAGPPSLNAQAARPNIVLMFPDNLGWGEVNVYGGVRGAITPRLDRLAAEGIRLNNFNVEFSCTVSRAALMTGRYAIRIGRDAGRRHHAVGSDDRRSAASRSATRPASSASGTSAATAPKADASPSHQGFDEYYGIPRTSNEAQTTIAQGQTAPNTSFIWEGRAGAPPRNVKPFDLETRRTVDRESAEKRHRVHGAQRRARGSRSSSTTR